MDEVSVYHCLVFFWYATLLILFLPLYGLVVSWHNLDQLSVYDFLCFPCMHFTCLYSSFIHLRYWLPEGQLRAALLNWFLTGFHWVTTINNFIICIWPDIWNLIGDLGRDIVLREEDPELKTCSYLHLPSNTLLSVLTETHRLPQVYENTISWFPNETG